MKLNVGAGPHLAPAPWINVDLHVDETAGITPDVLANLVDGLPFDDGTVTRLYAGHCVEHISILPRADGEIPFDLAMREIKRLLAPDGVAAFVCPDVYRAVNWYREGRAPFSLVDACLEGPDDGIDPTSAWDGCFHSWNCHEARLEAWVRRTFPEAHAINLTDTRLHDFPLVSDVGWQCAVLVPVP